jgi:hypothetical protein
VICAHKSIDLDAGWARPDGSADLLIILSARCLICGADLYFYEPIVTVDRRQVGVRANALPQMELPTSTSAKTHENLEADYRDRN